MYFIKARTFGTICIQCALILETRQWITLDLKARISSESFDQRTLLKLLLDAIASLAVVYSMCIVLCV